MLGLGIIHQCYEDYLVGFGCWLSVFSTNYWQTDLCIFKCDLWWFEWVYCWKVDFSSEGPLIIWSVVRNNKPVPSQ